MPLTMNGRLLLDDEKDVVVEINEELSAFQRDRTLAHELAHLVLERERIHQVVNAGRNVPRDISNTLIEKLCDEAADEILLPQDWLHQSLSGRSRATPSLEFVREIAEAAKLPVEFVVTRIIDLKLQPWRALWCRNTQQRFRILRSNPVWDESFLMNVEATDGQGSPMISADRSRDVQKGEIRLSILGDTQRFPTQCLQLDSDEIICILKIR